MIQVDDGDTHKEQLDDTSVGAPLEEEAEELSEGKSYKPVTGSMRMPCTTELFSKEQSLSLQEVN